MGTVYKVDDVTFRGIICRQTDLRSLLLGKEDFVVCSK